jgi:hypothetical protein
MDELRRIRELYGEPAADPALKARIRERLDAENRHSHWLSRRVSSGWLSWRASSGWLAGRASWRSPWRAVVGGLVGATVAVAAVVVTVVALALPRTAVEPHSVSGRSLLLAAATTAASGPAAEGRYWHLKKLFPGDTVTELWATRAGEVWIGKGTLGKPVKPLRFTGRAAFSMEARDLTVQQIMGLPSDPAALKAWVIAYLPPGADDGIVADAVSGLLWSKPSPPGVRAAAYRVLGDLPNVRYLGRSVDGQGRSGEAFAFAVSSDNERTLIIDPADSQVLSSTDSVGGSRQTEVVLEATWTDKGPTTTG